MTLWKRSGKLDSLSLSEVSLLLEDRRRFILYHPAAAKKDDDIQILMIFKANGTKVCGHKEEICTHRKLQIEKHTSRFFCQTASVHICKPQVNKDIYKITQLLHVIISLL